ncbi:MAG TPA: response regulator [Longilinea sp.]|nr:response regulator [Longilinea sp.]
MTEKILIVDDDIETLRLVGLMLQRQGYQIVAANNGTQAMAMARNENPDLIVLDVMMPDLDGYEVVRQLRKEKETASVPIIMFTAKSQVEDKVAGLEAGADDYLTKPVHPAELVAKIKALLSRGKTRVAVEQGYVIGVVGARGGLGVSTMTLNTALAYHRIAKVDVIAAELRPSQGIWGIELGFSESEGLGDVLRLKTSEITSSQVEKVLMRTAQGIRLLMAGNRIKDNVLMANEDQLVSVVKQLPLLAPVTFLDLGTSYLPGFERIANLCDEIILIVEPQPLSVQRTRILANELNLYGFTKNKYLTLVQVNRIRADIQLNTAQITESLKINITNMIPPVPELAYQAALHSVPLIDVQPEGLVAQQINRLAESIIQRRQK